MQASPRNETERVVQLKVNEIVARIGPLEVQRRNIDERLNAAYAELVTLDKSREIGLTVEMNCTRELAPEPMPMAAAPAPTPIRRARTKKAPAIRAKPAKAAKPAKPAKLKDTPIAAKPKRGRPPKAKPMGDLAPVAAVAAARANKANGASIAQLPN